jgi:hypothetical protein
MNANYLETVAAADRLTMDAAFLAGQLEAAHMAAAGRWACAMLDATAAGNPAMAAYAAGMADSHRAAADAARAVPNATSGKVEPSMELVA